MMGAPFKPGFGLSGIPQHSTRRLDIRRKLLRPRRRRPLSPVFDPAHGTQQGKTGLRYLKAGLEHIHEAGALQDVSTLLILG
jgi:hypothetical protein